MGQAPLTQEEFDQAERILAGLLTDASAKEEAAIYILHARFKQIFEQGSAYRSSQDRLWALQGRQHVRDQHTSNIAQRTR